jgi:hypothetical protein
MLKFRGIGLFAMAFFAGVLVTAFVRWPPAQSSDWAAWVQAVGSIGAIIGAIWIASEQTRREHVRRESETERASYLLSSELAWLSLDVLGFMNQFFGIKSGELYGSIMSDDDIANLLDRIAWCRQRAEHKGQLAMLGDLRGALMATVRFVRRKETSLPMTFTEGEAKLLQEWRDRAVKASNSANGIDVLPQHRA